MILMSNPKAGWMIGRKGGNSEMASQLRMALLQAQTRRHFLRTLSGVWDAVRGDVDGKVCGAANATGRSEAANLDFTRDASSPLSALHLSLPPKCGLIYLHMAGRQANGALRAQA